MFFDDWFGVLGVVVMGCTGYVVLSWLDFHQVTSLEPVHILLLVWALVLATMALITVFWTLADR